MAERKPPTHVLALIARAVANKPKTKFVPDPPIPAASLFNRIKRRKPKGK